VKNKTPKNKFEQYLALQSAATAELLEERKALQSQLRTEFVKFEKLLTQNAERLEKLGHKVKDDGLPKLGRSKRIKDDNELKQKLQVLLENKRLSIPQILNELGIARTRIAKFIENNKSFLSSSGGGRSKVYFLRK